MELTRSLADLFQSENLEEAPRRFPNLTLAIIKARQEPNRYRGIVTDGDYHTLMIINVASGAGDSLEAGDVLNISRYTIAWYKAQKDGADDTSVPLMRLLEYSKKGTQDVSDLHPTKLTYDIVMDLRRKAVAGGAAAAPAAPPTTSAAPAAASGGATRANPAAAAPKPRENVQPIEGITPYAQNWRIRARATQKTPIRKFHNDRGEGQVFNVTFVDETGEIQCTGFGEQVNKYYEALQEGQMYYVSKAAVKPARKQFSSVQNDFQLYLERDTLIEPAGEDASVPELVHSFIESFEKIENVAVDTTIDVMGIIKDIQETNKIRSKGGREYEKREITLVDRSGLQLRTTLWGQEATAFEGNVDDVLAIKGARVGEFSNAKNISSMRSSMLTINPNIREAHALKGWYDAQGRNQEFKVLKTEGGAGSAGDAKKREVKLIKDVIDERLGTSDTPDFFTIKAFITTVFTRTPFYAACTTDGCNKKVIQETNGDWKCEKCNATMSEPEYRYILSMIVADAVDSAEGFRVTMFDDVGRKVVGRSASEINALGDNEDAIKEALQVIQGREFFFRCKASGEEYQGNQRTRYQIMSASPIEDNLDIDTLDLLSQIEL